MTKTDMVRFHKSWLETEFKKDIDSTLIPNYKEFFVSNSRFMFPYGKQTEITRSEYEDILKLLDTDVYNAVHGDS